MKISYEVFVKITLYKKYTDGVVDIDNKIAGEVDEKSEEFKALCMEYENIIGFMREDDPGEFDKKLAMIMSEKLKGSMLEKIEEIKSVFKGCMQPKVTGTCEIFGTAFNPADFCAFKVHAIETRCNKK